MKKIPASAKPYKKTPEFTEETIPAGLLKAHQTKAGTWGKIHVSKGQLRYRILEPKFEELLLSEKRFGVESKEPEYFDPATLTPKSNYSDPFDF
jgi:tellurite resistance-related uncharacterized protein